VTVEAPDRAWPGIELRELHVFLTVAEELHFGRAAERLQVNRSRVSQIINTLETRIGGRLFDRTSRRVRLTPLGERVRADITPGYEQLLRAMAQARELASGIAGVLRIGFTAFTDGPMISHLIEAFQARHPECEVTFNEINIWEPYTKLRGGEIDVLVNWLAVDEPDLIIGPAISHHERVLAVARTHHLAPATSISLEQLGDEQVNELPASYPAALGDAILPPRTPTGRPIRRVPMPRNTHERLAHVARGDIVHLAMAGVPLFEREDIVLVPVDDLPPLALGLIWSKRNENATIRALAETARPLDNGATRRAPQAA
jgi:DNA-binding transcriptional LysR family regulator